METNNNSNRNAANSENNLQEDDQTTGSGYSQDERNRHDGTNENELDPGYYDDKENPDRKSENPAVDSNRNENGDDTEGVEPNR